MRGALVNSTTSKGHEAAEPQRALEAEVLIRSQNNSGPKIHVIGNTADKLVDLALCSTKTLIAHSELPY
jgi:hypothetical protein